MNKILIMFGPTASGKSRLAMELAGHLPIDIINADALQVYKDLRVLTARPSPQDEQAVPHKLYGFHDGRSAYSVSEWVKDAKHAITQSLQDDRLPVITGGTGFYIDALVNGLSPLPDIPTEIRDQHIVDHDHLDNEALHTKLAEIDPELADRLHPNDRQRILRGLLVYDQTGTKLSDWQAAPKISPLPDDIQVYMCVLNPPREELHQRADTRFDQMVELGALEEIQYLHTLNLPPVSSIFSAIGVKSLGQTLSGNLDLEAAISQSKQETRAYIKRQQTWIVQQVLNKKCYNKLLELKENNVQSVLTFIEDIQND